jgi:hypothetical protein
VLAEQHILEHGEAREEAQVLKRAPDTEAADAVALQATDLVAEKSDAA